MKIRSLLSLTNHTFLSFREEGKPSSAEQSPNSSPKNKDLKYKGAYIGMQTTFPIQDSKNQLAKSPTQNKKTPLIQKREPNPNDTLIVGGGTGDTDSVNNSLIDPRSLSMSSSGGGGPNNRASYMAKLGISSGAPRSMQNPPASGHNSTALNTTLTMGGGSPKPGDANLLSSNSPNNSPPISGGHLSRKTSSENDDLYSAAPKMTFDAKEKNEFLEIRNEANDTRYSEVC